MGIREYHNGEIVVIWQPHLCTHCEACWRGLPNVFDPNKTPWVNIGGDTTERIAEQVKLCESRALVAYEFEMEFKLGDGVVVVDGIEKGMTGKVVRITPKADFPFHVAFDPLNEARDSKQFTANELLEC